MISRCSIDEIRESILKERFLTFSFLSNFLVIYLVYSTCYLDEIEGKDTYLIFNIYKEAYVTIESISNKLHTYSTFEEMYNKSLNSSPTPIMVDSPKIKPFSETKIIEKNLAFITGLKEYRYKCNKSIGAKYHLVINLIKSSKTILTSYGININNLHKFDKLEEKITIENETEKLDMELEKIEEEKRKRDLEDIRNRL